MRPLLLSMDYTRGIVECLPDDAAARTMRTACDRAAAAGVPVAHVVVRFRPGHPEISARNRVFAPLLGGDMLVDGAANAEFHPAAAPRDGEPVLIKRRISAFTGSDLEVLLRSLDVDTLVLGGVSTSGVVLSTAREALDRDYRVVVLRDCCADFDAELHDILMDRLLARQAEVVDSGPWLDAALGR